MTKRTSDKVTAARQWLQRSLMKMRSSSARSAGSVRRRVLLAAFGGHVTKLTSPCAPLVRAGGREHEWPCRVRSLVPGVSCACCNFCCPRVVP
jgi:hypothetical protein